MLRLMSILLMGCAFVGCSAEKTTMDKENANIKVLMNDSLVKVKGLETIEVKKKDIQRTFSIQTERNHFLSGYQGVCAYRFATPFKRIPVLLNDGSFVLPVLRPAIGQFRGMGNGCLPYMVRVYPEKDSVELIKLNLFSEENFNRLNLSRSNKERIHNIKKDTSDRPFMLNRVSTYVIFPSNKGAAVLLSSNVINYGNWLLYSFTTNGEFTYEGLSYGIFGHYEKYGNIIWQAFRSKNEVEKIKIAHPSFFFKPSGFLFNLGPAIFRIQDNYSSLYTSRIIDQETGRYYHYFYRDDTFKLQKFRYERSEGEKHEYVRIPNNIQVKFREDYRITPFLEDGILYLICRKEMGREVLVVKVDTETGEAFKRTFTHPDFSIYPHKYNPLIPHIHSGRVFFTPLTSDLGYAAFAGIWKNHKNKFEIKLNLFEIKLDK